MTEPTIAARVSCEVCNCCGTVTVNFYDENGAAFATSTVDPASWIEMVNAVEQDLEEVLDRIIGDDEDPDKEHVH